MQRQNDYPVFLPQDAAVIHSGDHLNKDLQNLLQNSPAPRLAKSIPASDPGTTARNSSNVLPLRGAPSAATGSGAGAFFAPLLASGVIVNGTEADPQITRLFTRHVEAQIGKRSKGAVLSNQQQKG